MLGVGDGSAPVRSNPYSHALDSFSSGMAMALTRNLAAAIVSLATACIAWGGTAWADENERGEDLYRLCASCHEVDASGNELVGAPAIAGMAQWSVEAQLEKFRNGMLKRFKFPIRTTEEGKAAPSGGYATAHDDLNGPTLAQEPEALNSSAVYTL